MMGIMANSRAFALFNVTSGSQLLAIITCGIVSSQLYFNYLREARYQNCTEIWILPEISYFLILVSMFKNYM